jgi:hypothetical protein
VTERPERYGLSATHAKHPGRKSARRHVWWSGGASKCGDLLAVETADMTIPLCGRCRVAMARLCRNRGIKV